MLSRRRFLHGTLVTASAVAGSSACGTAPQWTRAGYLKQPTSRVAILKATDYDRPLASIVVDGIKACKLDVAGKRILLKPNMVEFDPTGVINTNPRVIVAAIEAFRQLGAREVVVGEGPGHHRDTEYLLKASGLAQVLKEHRARFVDLNEDAVRSVPLESRFTKLGHLYFPETVLDADLLVSMPKLKTHHWAGVTLSMKNLFGVVPSAVYGWPKNALHYAGINESILDINSTLSLPRFAIIDGIVGMEGNGPIQGRAKPCGVLIFGEDLPAVDATAARVMKLEPTQIPYLAEAERFLGNTAMNAIAQLGEDIGTVQQDFAVIDQFQRLKQLV
jgi:uncharacterized protein (DUF362 family)